MGIYERDYLETGRGQGNPLAGATRTAVGLILVVTVATWFLQILVRSVTDLLAASQETVLGLQLWRLVTANLAHDPNGVWHLIFNMVVLFFFGREVEQLYGKRNFLFLYFAAGVLAILAQTLTTPGLVLGASGAVLAVLVVFACHYPRRTVLFMFFIPMPIWLLCVIVLVMDALGALAPASRDGQQVAHLAHLAGAALGFLFFRYDLRLERLGLHRLAGSPRPPQAIKARRSAVKRFRKKQAARSEPEAVAPDPVSERIDTLLAKISNQGKDSLTQDEWDFLKLNSGRYRSK